LIPAALVDDAGAVAAALDGYLPPALDMLGDSGGPGEEALLAEQPGVA
jgi:hypothetical protein